MPTSPTAAPVRVLNQAEVLQYHRDGFLIVRGLYSGDQMLQWKAILKDLIAKEPRNPHGVRVWNTQGMHPALREAMRDQHVGPILQQIISPHVEFLSAKAVWKSSDTDFPSPWHQDWFYWEGAHKMSIWIAMDDATPQNGCLKFVPGSHRRVFPKFVAANEGFGNRIRDEDLGGWPVVSAEMKRGDVAFFHDLAVHSSYPNTAKSDRWSFISTYRDASVLDKSGLTENLWKTPMLVSGQSVNNGVALESMGL